MDGVSMPEYRRNDSNNSLECESEYSIILEEVENSDYYNKYGLPKLNDRVYLKNGLVEGRLCVEHNDTSEIVGLLPTIHNDLYQCQKKGFKYEGEIVHVENLNIVKVIITIRKIV